MGGLPCLLLDWCWLRSSGGSGGRGWRSERVPVHVRAIAVTAVRGRALLSVVDGRLPHGDGQISLGATTMRRARARVGFVRHRVAAVVCWQATTVALIGIVAGIPLGMAAGQVTWRVLAVNLGAVPVPVVPAGLLAALAGVALGAANVLAVSPALIAARSHPAELLRTQ